MFHAYELFSGQARSTPSTGSGNGSGQARSTVSGQALCRSDWMTHGIPLVGTALDMVMRLHYHDDLLNS